MPDETDQAREYFTRLQALRTGHDEGWFEWLAGDVKNSGRHVVGLVDGLRVLGPDAYWWTLGVADSYGFGDLITDLMVDIPELITVNDAADMLGLTVAGVSFRITRGHLLVLYPGGRRRLLTAQVRDAAGIGTDDDREQVDEIVGLLPTPVASLDPVLLRLQATQVLEAQTVARAKAPEADRRLAALHAAQNAKLIRYLWMDPPKDLYAASITVGDGSDAVTTVRQLAGPTVRPWLQGVCDRNNQSHIVPPRLAN